MEQLNPIEIFTKLKQTTDPNKTNLVTQYLKVLKIPVPVPILTPAPNARDVLFDGISRVITQDFLDRVTNVVYKYKYKMHFAINKRTIPLTFLLSKNSIEKYKEMKHTKDNEAPPNLQHEDPIVRVFYTFLASIHSVLEKHPDLSKDRIQEVLKNYTDSVKMKNRQEIKYKDIYKFYRDIELTKSQEITRILELKSRAANVNRKGLIQHVNHSKASQNKPMQIYGKKMNIEQTRKAMAIIKSNPTLFFNAYTGNQQHLFFELLRESANPEHPINDKSFYVSVKDLAWKTRGVHPTEWKGDAMRIRDEVVNDILFVGTQTIELMHPLVIGKAAQLTPFDIVLFKSLKKDDTKPSIEIVKEHIDNFIEIAVSASMPAGNYIPIPMYPMEAISTIENTKNAGRLKIAFISAYSDLHSQQKEYTFDLSVLMLPPPRRREKSTDGRNLSWMLELAGYPNTYDELNHTITVPVPKEKQKILDDKQQKAQNTLARKQAYSKKNYRKTTEKIPNNYQK